MGLQAECSSNVHRQSQNTHRHVQYANDSMNQAETDLVLMCLNALEVITDAQMVQCIIPQKDMTMLAISISCSVSIVNIRCLKAKHPYLSVCMTEA